MRVEKSASIVGLKTVGSKVCWFTPLHLLSSQVLSVGNLYNPDVRYTFNIPIEDKPQQFYWNAYGPWQPCSKLCQGGCLGRLHFVLGLSGIWAVLSNPSLISEMLTAWQGTFTPPQSQVSLATWSAGEQTQPEMQFHGIS